MRNAEWTDEQLVGRLLALPDLNDGVEALEYWRRRHRRLPWWRIRARKEAARMSLRWEQRVRAAVLAQRRAPLETRFAAGVLVARVRLARWTRRVGIVVTATLMTLAVLVAVPIAAALVYLLHAL